MSYIEELSLVLGILLGILIFLALLMFACYLIIKLCSHYKERYIKVNIENEED